MIPLILAASFTIIISAFCSLLEAMLLSTSTTDIESLKQSSPRKGAMLDKFKTDIEETSSAILSLNTVANTLGAVTTGVLASSYFGPETIWSQYIIPAGMTIGILVLSEVIPKNIGVIYRKSLQPHLVYSLYAVRFLMVPISLLCKSIVLQIIGEKNEEEVGDEDIKLLAEKSAKEGTLTVDESNMISNALSLDEVKVEEVMTPRTVVTAYEQSQTVGDIFEEDNNIPFARMPVYDDNIDNIVGLIRRRDMLKAKAADQDETTVKDIMLETVFIPENANGTNALKLFLKSHQQLAVVVDEFGSMSGVITVEDIMEHILGREIFEKDDVAIDMREFARRKKLNEASSKSREIKDNDSPIKESLNQ